MKKIFLFTLILTMLLSVVCLSSCVTGFYVTVQDGEHFTVEGESTVKVRAGESASFKLNVDEGYAFDSSNFGSFDEETGTLTVKRVTKDLEVHVTVAKGFSVTLSTGTGVSCEEPTLLIHSGGDAEFVLSFDAGYVFAGASKGTYYPATKKLVISNVKSSTAVSVTASHVDYDTTKEVYLSLKGSSKDTATISGKVTLGTPVTVKAGDKTRIFLGWYFGSDKNNVVSTEREYSFTVNPTLVSSNMVTVTPLYKKINTYYFDANGGTINTASTQIKSPNTTYLKIDSSNAQNGTIKCTMTDAYIEALACATAFYNDGTFSRGGYVLKEYNTKADGTGEPYSPGDLFYPYLEGVENFTLYCIWEKVTESNFTTSTYSKSKPWGHSYLSWTSSGVYITGYTGNETTVAIPETIGGQKVLGIKAGAFSGKNFTTLILPRTLQTVENGAFVGCSSLTTVYYPNGLWSMTDNAFDSATKTNFKTLIVYHSIAPRFETKEYGTWAFKLSRLLSTVSKKQLIVVAGSSSYQGLASEYLYDLLDGEYEIVNMGTTRTTHGSLYLEAMGHYADENDIVIFAPENSAFMMGDTELYYKTVRDLHRMNNLWRYVDISNFTHVVDALCDFAQSRTTTNETFSGLYKSEPERYEDIAAQNGVTTNIYGDFISISKNGYVGTSTTSYVDPYILTFNNRFKSNKEGKWSTSGNQTEWQASKNSEYWVSIDQGTFKAQIEKAVTLAKAGGATVYFGFCPADVDAMAKEAKNAQWLASYDEMMKNTFGFDDILGTAEEYLYAHEYFFDNCFHTNNYGRTWRTYQLYLDICEKLGKDASYKNGALGTNYEGCKFEFDESGKVLQSPKYSANYLED